MSHIFCNYQINTIMLFGDLFQMKIILLNQIFRMDFYFVSYSLMREINKVPILIKGSWPTYKSLQKKEVISNDFGRRQWTKSCCYLQIAPTSRCYSMAASNPMLLLNSGDMRVTAKDSLLAATFCLC